MAHEHAKEGLLYAATLRQRAVAVRGAIASGMPLVEVEEFLDHLDATVQPGHTLLSSPERAAPSAVPAPAAMGMPVRAKGLPDRIRWAPVPAALAAGLVLAVTLGGIWLYRLSAGRGLQPVYVAELCGSADARWSPAGGPEADGRLAADRRLVLSAGLAEIAFASGARVILQGPAEFEPQSPTGGLLSHGQLTARVPPAARGFMVRAPDAAVVDLGTEFGIAVEQGKLSDVEVFAGRVEVGLDAEPTGAKQTVRAGKAIHVWSPTAGARPLVETTTAGLMHFVRSLSSADKPSGAAVASTTAAKRFGIPEAATELTAAVHKPQGRLVYLDLAPNANEALSRSKGTTPGNDLMELGPGAVNLAGVPFRVGNATIQLGSKQLSKEPSQVAAIAVQRRVGNLYFLHAAQWADPRFGIADGARIGHYLIRYADGSQETIPIVSGEDVRDWWSHDHKKLATRGQVVWVGRNAATTAAKIYLRLYLGVWANPHPEKAVASLDYVSAMTVAAPFCAAITVEMPAPDQDRRAAR